MSRALSKCKYCGREVFPVNPAYPDRCCQCVYLSDLMLKDLSASEKILIDLVVKEKERSRRALYSKGS